MCFDYRSLSPKFRKATLKWERRTEEFLGYVALIKAGRREGADAIDAVWAMREEEQDQRQLVRYATRMIAKAKETQ